MTWAAFLMVPIIGFVGLGVDTARGYLVRARLSQALDSAGLAAGRWTYSTTKATEEAQMVFKANFPTNFMDSTVTGPTIKFQNLSTGNDLITVKASAVLPTYFARVVGVDTFTVSAESEITRKTVYMDVVVSIDVSGSMNDSINGVVKIDAARTAANILVDSLFGTAETKELLKMGFVTWSANARILPIGTSYVRSQTTSQTVPSFKNPYDGSSNITTIWYAKDSPVPLLSRPPNGWTGCVEARWTNDSTTNDADTVIDYPVVGSRNWMVFRPATTNSSGDAMQCPNHGTQRMTHTKSTIKGAIAQVTAGSGNTNLVAGITWGWSLLGKVGPFTGDETPPPQPNEGELVRAMILMTDGDNTQSNTDAYRGTRTASQLDARTRLAAQAAKDAGVIIYAIRFGAASSSEALLKEIATGPTAPYYQYAPDAAALEAAFQEIGNHLSRLRLSR